MAEGNTHPISGAGSGLVNILKSNPVGAFLLAMLALAFIVPPRKRKYRPKKKRSRKKRKVSRLNPGRQVKRSKKRKKPVSRICRKRTPVKRVAPGPQRTPTARKTTGRKKRPVPAGYSSWAAYMKHLRSLRKK